jgi:hypothetical protein
MLTHKEEISILDDPATRHLVRDILNLAEGKDIVDAAADAAMAADILEARAHRALHGSE